MLLRWVRDYYASMSGRLGVGEELLEPRLLDDREDGGSCKSIFFSTPLLRIVFFLRARSGLDWGRGSNIRNG